MKEWLFSRQMMEGGNSSLSKRGRTKEQAVEECEEDESSEEELDEPNLAKLRRFYRQLTDEEKLAAIGDVEDRNAKQYWFDPGFDFAPVPLPTHRDDYLAQNIVRGQSFQKWKDVNYTPVTDARPTIYLVPIGDFHVTSGMQDAEFDFLEALRSYTSAFYLGMEVTLLPAVKIIHEIQEDDQEGSASPKPEEPIDYQSLTCERLRELLRKRGCKTSGSKRQLVERLQEADEEESEDSESPKYRTYLEYQPSGGGSVKRGEAVCRKAHEYDLDDSLPDARQFYISSICDFLQTIKPKDARCLIGVTMEDLYCSTDDSFTMGLAYSGRVGLFSFGRYHPGRIWRQSELEEREKEARRGRRKGRGKKRQRKGKEEQEEEERNTRRDHLYTLLNRSCKVLVHEIGHLFGIGHCIYFDCCMNGSGHLKEDYRQAMHLCPVDLHKLQHCLGFDVEVRYRRMAAFYRKYLHGFQPEVKWVEQRLRFLESKRPGVESQMVIDEGQ